MSEGLKLIGFDSFFLEFSQFVQSLLHLEQLALHQRSQDGQATLLVAGFVQHPIDLCLVCPQVRVTLQKLLALGQRLYKRPLIVVIRPVSL